MTRDASFWRNLSVIALFHVAIFFAIALWSASTKKPLGAGIVWMERSSDQPIPTTSAQLQVQDSSAATEEEEMASDEPADEPVAREATAAPKATPKKSRVSPTPKVAKIAAKKTPKSSAKVAAKKEEHSKKSGDVTGTGNQASGAGNPSQFSWYGNMLHDRFFSSWDQPTSVVATGAKMSVLVRLRIESDGRVSSFALVRPSGNVVVDQSVAAVAKRVTQVDPLPSGLGNGGHYDVNINFELNAD